MTRWRQRLINHRTVRYRPWGDGELTLELEQSTATYTVSLVMGDQRWGCRFSATHLTPAEAKVRAEELAEATVPLSNTTG